MARKPRTHHTYDLKDGREVVYRGESDDVERRAKEHEADGKKFTRVVVTSKRALTDEGAKKREAEELARYRRGHGGKNPKYNKDDDG